MTDKHNTSRSTVSLIHLLLVLSTISILSCAAILHWFGRADITLDNAVSLLVEDLRHVQGRAVLENRELHVVFFEDGSGYEVLRADGQPIRGPLGAPIYRRRYSADAVFAGVTVNALELGGARRVIYTPSGPVPPQGSICLGFGGELRSLEIMDTSWRMAVIPPDSRP